METATTNKIPQLIDFLEKIKGYFFLARLCLKVGRDLTEIKTDDPEDPELLGKVKQAAKELGALDTELEKSL